MELETINKLFLELAQVATVKTDREKSLELTNAGLFGTVKELRAEIDLLKGKRESFRQGDRVVCNSNSSDLIGVKFGQMYLVEYPGMSELKLLNVDIPQPAKAFRHATNSELHNECGNKNERGERSSVFDKLESK